MNAADTWAFCRPCDRWFHCPDWFDRFAPQPVCPTCAAEPGAVVVREASSDEVARTRIEGQCPRCGAWFDADDWFDETAPVPCCPTCALVPSRLAYVHGAGRRVERVLTVDLTASEQWLG